MFHARKDTIYPMRRTRILGLAVSLLLSLGAWAQTSPTVYLIPGTGGDHRLYDNLALQGYDTVRVHWVEPAPEDQMADLAQRLLPQIDTTQPHVLVGVSLGGMVATELATLTHPEAVILISSAKTREELPIRYRFQRQVPLYRWVGGQFLKDATPLGRFLFEPSSYPHRAVFNAMIDDKTPHFMEEGVRIICEWQRTEPPAVPTLHLHGSRDHTLPYRTIGEAQPIAKGSHMMVYTQGATVGATITNWLNQTLVIENE